MWPSTLLSPRLPRQPLQIRRPRVLFLSHSASLNGASILLLEFMRWLRQQVDWDLHVQVHGSGPLLHHFESVARTTIWRDPGPRLQALLPPSMPWLRGALAGGYAALSGPSRGFDLVYANTAAAEPMVRALRGRSRPLLWHVHELQYTLQLSLRGAAAQARFRTADRYVAVSAAVRDTLVAAYGIAAHRIDAVPGFVPGHDATDEEKLAKRVKLRAELQLPADAFLVGACGSQGWRKGSDVFLQVARCLCALPEARKLHFVWVGGADADAGCLAFGHDLRALGLQARCRHVPTTSDARDWYAAMDAFALTSREDPFPLVVLEAADRGLPIVGFENAGGANEFIAASGGGMRVPYLDVQAFAQALLRLHLEPGLACETGRRGRQEVRSHHRVHIQGPALLRSMLHCMGGENSAPVAAPDPPPGAPLSCQAEQGHTHSPAR